MFKEIPQKTFAELEEEVLKFWQGNKIFEKSVQARADGEEFVLFDGPPFATGLPHYGHLLAGTIKDVVPRYKTMKGFHAPRRFGWDCHGLPVEQEIEKAEKLSGAASIEAFGIAKFNEACRSIVQRYSKEWETTVHRMGRWVDFEHRYLTMDLSYMEAVWGVFKQLFEKDLVYEGFRVMPFSAKLGTPLSNFEAGENYKEVDDPSITIELPLLGDDASLLVWTTTPWTLPSNLAAMVGPEIHYAKVYDPIRDKRFVMAKERVPEEFEILDTFLGADLEGRKYEPPFDYFKSDFRVILSEEVSTDEGTGIVHCAPAFGETDFYAAKKAGIDLVCPVDNNGCFTKEIPEYQGKFVKDTDKDIIRRLKEAGKLFDQRTIHHRYPFCWRSDTPLIYKAVSTWFVKVEEFRDDLLKMNEQIHWVPAHLKEGRFGKWLAQARDWNIARSRYWGTPIPLYRSGDELYAVGSIKELEELTGEKIDDLHRHKIDHLTFEKDGKTFTRIPDVFDCWFESGSMPYASNKEVKLPADFIAEGLDQTRGWFYTLTVLSTLLHKKPAFKNVVVNGILLAEDGTKMSKRLQNYPPVENVINKYGADAIRLYMLHSPAVRADDLRFSEHGVEVVMRQILLPLWNAYSFFTTYARIYDWKPNGKTSDVTIDKWMLSTLYKLIHQVEEGMDGYDLSRAVEPFVSFIDQLTNWYIRLNRRRFWEGDSDDAFSTLYTVLVELTKIAAPFIPFLSDVIYKALTGEESVHLCDYPKPGIRDERLEAAMDAVQIVANLGHGLRKQHKVKVRQPLRAVNIVSGNAELLTFLEEQQHLIATELNVKDVILSSDESQFVKLQAKPNFRVLGKKVGKLMRQVQAAIGEIDQTDLAKLRAGDNHTLYVEGEEIVLTPEDISVQREVKEGMDAANHGQITLILDTKLDEELLLEGIARELVNKVSSMRKDDNLDYTARIKLIIDTTERVKKSFNAHRDYIMHELLATDVFFAPCEGETWELNGEQCTIKIESI